MRGQTFFLDMTMPSAEGRTCATVATVLEPLLDDQVEADATRSVKRDCDSPEFFSVASNVRSHDLSVNQFCRTYLFHSYERDFHENYGFCSEHTAPELKGPGSIASTEGTRDSRKRATSLSSALRITFSSIVGMKCLADFPISSGFLFIQHPCKRLCKSFRAALNIKSCIIIC